MDEAMRPFFLEVDIPISCPLRGSGAGFAKPGILPSGGSPRLRRGWCQPGDHALAAALLPPLCGIFSACTGAAAATLPAGWKCESVPVAQGALVRHPPSPPSASSAAQTSGILQMVLLNISCGCNSSICLPLS